MNNLIYRLIIFVAIIISLGCKKEWLDKKPDKSLVIPTSIKDLQALLDNDPIINSSDVSLSEIGSDDYYLRPANYQGLYEYEKNAYRWLANIFTDQNTVEDWVNAYKAIHYSNLTLEGIENISMNNENKESWSNVKGSALFHRSWNFYQLSQIFANTYNPSTASTDPGVPLRTKSDINIRYDRGTVQELYDRILIDLKEAAHLLPTSQTINKFNRPTKQAAYAFLSRVYLSMSNYDSALYYADNALNFNNTLVNFNDLNAFDESPLNFNSEILIMKKSSTYFHFYGSRVDTDLFNSYDINDLRKYVYFNELATGVRFKGSYYYYPDLFTGLAIDELYLTKAECFARKGDIVSALTDLNALLQTRWREGEFTPYTAVDAEDALTKIITERRKELLFRGLRWTDLRRLNLDNRFAKSLHREVDGQIFELPPNDKRYIYPIPPDEILYNSLAQNPR